MKIIKLYPYIALITLFAASCKDFVDVGDPQNILVTQKVFGSDATAISATTSIYAQMQTSSGSLPVQGLPYSFSMWAGIAADELTNYSTVYTPVGRNALLSEDSPTNGIWNLAYSLIYQSNAVFEGCSNSPALSAAVKKQLMAEARLIRAFWYFHLVNLYGPVPLITSTDYKLNAITPRQPVDGIYSQVISDLKYAKDELNENYIALNSTTTSTDRVRPNKATASALLARVYLYRKDYANAAAEATTVIGNPAYTIETIERAFLTSSKEAVWQLAIATPANNRNTWEGTSYVLTGKPTSGSSNSTSVSQSLLSSFYNNDKRKSGWIGKATDKTVTPNVDYFFPAKYKVVSSATITERSAVLRLAEQYLIRAEARAATNLPGAIADLDVVRKRGEIPLIADIRPAITEVELRDSILLERRRELFAEWGHRWLDLKRVGKIDEVMSKEAIVKGITWDPRQALWPIPYSETQRNPALGGNNPGYN